MKKTESMKQLLLLFICLSSIFYSSAQLTNRTVTVGSISRTYKQYLPVGFDAQTEQIPLIIALHGLGGTSNDLVATGVNLIADTARFMVMFPQALPNSFGQNAWNNSTLLSSTADDLGFLNQLIDSAILNYNADPSRIYVCGFSMGSIMSYHAACHLNDRVAAIGCMAGTMPTSDIQNCVPTYATPVIHLHGTADGTVPYGANPYPSLSLVPETIDFWRNVHGCDATADSTQFPNIANDNITVDRFVYNNCNPTGSLELYRLNGADHVYLYKPLNDITEIIDVWRFLSQWQHSSPAPAGIQNQVQNDFIIYPNPSAGKITISSNKKQELAVYNAQGKKVATLNGAATVEEFDISYLVNGIYYISNGTSGQKVSILH